MRRRSRSRRDTTATGFTLIELLLVLAIVGIIIAFILTAAMDGVRRAEERATQALITKLEMGMTDRVDAITATRADALPSHQYFAGIWWASTGWVPPPPDSFQPPFSTSGNTATNPVVNNIRAQILARFDQVRAELPDVFFLQPDKNYPLNFVAVAYPIGTELDNSISTSFPPSGYGKFLLPMGVGVLNDPAGVSSNGVSVGGNPPLTFPYVVNNAASPPALVQVPPVTPASTGIFGASYTAAGGLYKSLFEAAQRNNPTLAPPTPKNAGFDGVDNGGIFGLVDDISENGALAPAMKSLLLNHTHKTARAEMLYALLVNGQGPFGSSFSRDDFSDAEVRDTDNDGLPEFVDAWGEPLQYFRWPIFFQSDTQRGPGFYGPLETRDVNTLDPNQTLVDPAWWSATSPGGGLSNSNSPFGSFVTLSTKPASSLSGSAAFFQSYFHSLVDANTDPSLKSPAGTGNGWDRGSSASPFFARREYYSKFVILSGGPDKALGVPILDPDFYNAIGQIPPAFVIGTGGANVSAATAGYVMTESQAAQAVATRAGPFYSFGSVYPPPNAGTPSDAGPNDTVSIAIREAGHDDISSHNLFTPGGATQ